MWIEKQSRGQDYKLIGYVDKNPGCFCISSGCAGNRKPAVQHLHWSSHEQVIYSNSHGSTSVDVGPWLSIAAQPEEMQKQPGFYLRNRSVYSPGRRCFSIHNLKSNITSHLARLHHKRRMSRRLCQRQRLPQQLHGLVFFATHEECNHLQKNHHLEPFIRPTFCFHLLAQWFQQRQARPEVSP